MAGYCALRDAAQASRQAASAGRFARSFVAKRYIAQQDGAAPSASWRPEGTANCRARDLTTAFDQLRGEPRILRLVQVVTRQPL